MNRVVAHVFVHVYMPHRCKSGHLIGAVVNSQSASNLRVGTISHGASGIYRCAVHALLCRLQQIRSHADTIIGRYSPSLESNSITCALVSQSVWMCYPSASVNSQSRCPDRLSECPVNLSGCLDDSSGYLDCLFRCLNGLSESLDKLYIIFPGLTVLLPR